METSVKLYSLKHSNVKTYLFALLFVAGNIALPQLCHLVPYGGPTLLPIYFFTLIAAYKYGFLVGLLTAILSPVINHLLFAMPSEAVLPILLIKSSLLAGASALAARTIKSVSLLAILGVVLTYQVIGVLHLNGPSSEVSTKQYRTSVSVFRECYCNGSADTPS